MTDAERRAFAIALAVRREAAKAPDERRIDRALRFAGADLVRWSEKNGTFEVTFRVDGAEHTTWISKSDLSLVGAGICLSDRDGEFDLTSLVGVIREHRRRD